MSKCPQVEIAELKEEVERLTVLRTVFRDEISKNTAAMTAAAERMIRLTAERDALLALFRKLDNRGDPFDTFTQSVVREALDKHEKTKG